jgi:uncharacterized OB-fold protein
MLADRTNKKVPLKEGLFTPPSNGDDGYLIGSKCKSCGEYFHPKRAVCANCYSQDQEEVALSKEGKIFTYTVVRTSYPGSLFTPPFITAQIELPGSVIVLSAVTDIDLDKIKIETSVKLYFLKAGEDEAGNDIMMYAFRPIKY